MSLTEEKLQALLPFPSFWHKKSAQIKHCLSTFIVNIIEEEACTHGFPGLLILFLKTIFLGNSSGELEIIERGNLTDGKGPLNSFQRWRGCMEMAGVGEQGWRGVF